MEEHGHKGAELREQALSLRNYRKAGNVLLNTDLGQKEGRVFLYLTAAL